MSETFWKDFPGITHIGVGTLTTRPSTSESLAHAYWAWDTGDVYFTNNDLEWVLVNAPAISGITQLTGDVTAGPGSGSQVATLATVNSNAGTYTWPTIVINAKGLITAASEKSSPVLGVGVGGSPLTMSGTSVFPVVNLTVPLAPAWGGTGITSPTAKALLIANGTGTMALLAPGTNRNVVISNGTDWQSRALVAADVPSGAGSPLTAKGDIFTHDGTSSVRQAVGTNEQSLNADSSTSNGVSYAQRLARNFRAPASFQIRKMTAAILTVGMGMMEVAGTLVEKTSMITLTMSTNGDWIGGASNEAASEYVWVYADNAGNIKFHNVGPNYPRANTASRVADMRVNQAGWNGTAGSGLNDTSVVYDTDTGEGSIVAGMYALIYSDSAYTTGRGRGSAAAASRNHVSAALITAVNTGTNTLTLEAGHNIAINDNDYMIVVEPGALIYRQESSVWWRLIGSMYNNSSSDLDDERRMSSAVHRLDQGADYTIASTSFADVDSTNLALPLFSQGADVLVTFFGEHTNSTSNTRWDINMDGIAVGGDTGILMTTGTAATTRLNAALSWLVRNMLPGTHTFTLRWCVTLSSTTTLHAGAGTANLDLHPQFVVREIRD